METILFFYDVLSIYDSIILACLLKQQQTDSYDSRVEIDQQGMVRDEIIEIAEVPIQAVEAEVSQVQAQPEENNIQVITVLDKSTLKPSFLFSLFRI